MYHSVKLTFFCNYIKTFETGRRHAERKKNKLFGTTFWWWCALILDMFNTYNIQQEEAQAFPPKFVTWFQPWVSRTFCSSLVHRSLFSHMRSTVLSSLKANCSAKCGQRNIFHTRVQSLWQICRFHSKQRNQAQCGCDINNWSVSKLRN